MNVESGTHRLIKRVSEAEMSPMERYGKTVSGMRSSILRFDDETGTGCFVVEFEPGGVSVPHEHPGAEEFYVLEGELHDHDGHAYKAGQFVSLGAGTRHYSYSDKGARVLVWLTEPNRALHATEALSFGPDSVHRAQFSDVPVEPSQTSAPGQERLVHAVDSLEFTPFDRYGDDVPKLFWTPVSFNRETGKGCFIIRFKPGGVSTPHEHYGMEEFYVLEGEVVDHDGVAYQQGDFVSLGPGVRHYSYSPQGVLVLAWLTDTNRRLSEGEALSFGPDVVGKARYRP